MIAANVAAAETLERARQPCMYRVHDAPDAAKLEALREFVATLGFNLAKGPGAAARDVHPAAGARRRHALRRDGP